MRNRGKGIGETGGGFPRRDLLRGAAALAAGAALGGSAVRAFASMAPPLEGVSRQVARLVTKEAGSLRILQVTDCHMNFAAAGYLGEPDKVKAIAAMVSKFKPDIIMNTGDFWSNVTDEKVDTCKWLCREFAKFKTPWAFAWGNHDESTDYNRTHRVLETAPYSLYRGAAADGNYRIEVTAPDGSGPLWNLIVMNNSRGGFSREQIDWFNAEAAAIRESTPAPPPAFLFFHIPLPQYDDIAAPGRAVGVKFEKVCHENGSRDALQAFTDAGFVKAMFCGHDHVNDYYGDIGGLRLQYGRALGGYGKEKVRKGATLIVATRDSFETKSVFPDGSSVTYDEFISEPVPGRIY